MGGLNGYNGGGDWKGRKDETVIALVIRRISFVTLNIMGGFFELPYTSEIKHPFFALNVGQSPHNSGQNRYNSGQGAYFRVVLNFGGIR